MSEIMEILAASGTPFIDLQLTRFNTYYNMLVDWNTRMNLTAITAEKDIAQKHFLDSILPMQLIKQGASCIDVGSGAGFPGIPLLIMRDDITMTLLDSLNKRLLFLHAVCDELMLKAQIVHARAEDAGQNAAHREKYDVALSRALKPASECAELTTPFIKVGGVSLMYKGQGAEDELTASQGALFKLKCKGSVRSFPTTWGERNVLEIIKHAPTPKLYPRKAGTIGKQPL